MNVRFNFDGYVDNVKRRFRDHYDDNNSVIAGNLTRATLKELIEYKHSPTMWANGDLISLNTGIDEGADSVDWFMMDDEWPDHDGFIGPDGRFPQIDVKGEVNNNKVHEMGCGFSFKLRELSKWQMQGFNVSLPQAKARATRRFHDSKLNRAILLGASSKSITGVINQPGSYQIIAGTYSGTTGTWSGAAATQITDTVERTYSAIDDGSQGNLKPNTAVLPTTMRNILRRQNSLANGDSIFNWLKDTFKEITKWEFDPLLNTAGLGGTAAMVMYNRDKDHVSALMPMLLRPLPIFIKHEKTTQNFMSAFAGLECPFPTAIAVLSGI